MNTYDVIIIGAGVSGSFMAQDLAENGLKVLILEAGSSFTRTNYPKKEIDSNSRLYWGGGIELNTSAKLGLLRPKVVGGGSIVNQALVDRFDTNAFDSWRKDSGISFFNEEDMKPWYEKAENEVVIQKIPSEFANGNAKIFADGFAKNGFTCAPLSRAQKGCDYQAGNDCIECLAGCRIDSKQSMPVTTLRRALKAGAHLVSDFEVMKVTSSKDMQTVSGFWNNSEYTFKSKRLFSLQGPLVTQNFSCRVVMKNQSQL